MEKAESRLKKSNILKDKSAKIEPVKEKIHLRLKKASDLDDKSA